MCDWRTDGWTKNVSKDSEIYKALRRLHSSILTHCWLFARLDLVSQNSFFGIIWHLHLHSDLYNLKTNVSNQPGSTDTSLTGVSYQMRSGKLPANLSLNSLSNGKVLCSLCYFIQIQPGLQITIRFLKNPTWMWQTDQWTYGRTYEPTDTPSFRNVRTHLKRKDDRWLSLNKSFDQLTLW